MNDTLFEKAQAALRRYKIKTALEYFKQIIKDNPDNALAYQGAAYALSNLGKYEDAMQMSIKALELNPGLVIPHTVLAYAYDVFGDKEKSRNEAQTALEMDSTSVEALCCMGVLLVLDNKEPDARRYLEEAVKIDPSHYLAQYNLAVVYQDLNDKRLFHQSVVLLKLRPGIRNLLKVLFFFGRLHRVGYLVILFLSAIASLFTRPEVVLFITGILMAFYLTTGIFIAFRLERRKWRELIINIVMSVSFGMLGLVMYFMIKIAQMIIDFAM